MIQIINNYENILHNLPSYIEESGYKNSFLSAKLGLSRITFQRKKANLSFTLNEMKTLAKYIFAQEYIKQNDLLNQILDKSLEQSKKGKLISNAKIKRSTNV